MIERLLTPGSIPKPAMRCVLGKTLYAYFPLGPRPLWWPSLRKDLQTEPKKECSALVWLYRRRAPALHERIEEAVWLLRPSLEPESKGSIFDMFNSDTY